MGGKPTLAPRLGDNVAVKGEESEENTTGHKKKEGEEKE